SEAFSPMLFSAERCNPKVSAIKRTTADVPTRTPPAVMINRPRARARLPSARGSSSPIISAPQAQQPAQEAAYHVVVAVLDLRLRHDRLPRHHIFRRGRRGDR